MNGFRIGDVIVCVGKPGRIKKKPFHTDVPVKGRHYRINGTLVGIDAVNGGQVQGVYLEGMRHDPAAGYHAACFRKIEAPKSEVADRIRACNPRNKRVPA